MLVPMAEALMGWTERDISIFFSAAGVEVRTDFKSGSYIYIALGNINYYVFIS